MADTSTSKTTSSYAAPLFRAGMSRIKSTLPVLQAFASQILESIRTGGLTSAIPSINRTQSALREQSSQNLTETAESLSMHNVRGSAAEGIIAGGEATAGEQIANVGPDFARAMMGAAPGIGLDTGGFSAVQAAMGGNISTSSSYQPGFWSTFNNIAGSAAQGAGEGFGFALAH
jgi:hypothetical protein